MESRGGAHLAVTHMAVVSLIGPMAQFSGISIRATQGYRSFLKAASCLNKGQLTKSSSSQCLPLPGSSPPF